MNRKILIRKIKNGNEQALNELLDEVYPKIYRFVYVLVHGDEKAKDITQDTCIRFIKAIEHYEEQGNLEAYLCKIAMNITYDYMRKANKMMEEEYIEEVYGDESYDAKDILHKKQDQIWLQQQLQMLPLLQKEAILLKYFVHLKHREIANLYDVSESTIKTRIRLGIEKLKEKGENNETN